jgi:hypothetical protein
MRFRAYEDAVDEGADWGACRPQTPSTTQGALFEVHRFEGPCPATKDMQRRSCAWPSCHGRCCDVVSSNEGVDLEKGKRNTYSSPALSR